MSPRRRRRSWPTYSAGSFSRVVEVERLGPVAGDEAAHEVCDHPWQGEQQLVDGIVHRRTVAPPRRGGAGAGPAGRRRTERIVRAGRPRCTMARKSHPPALDRRTAFVKISRGSGFRHRHPFLPPTIRRRGAQPTVIQSIRFEFSSAPRIHRAAARAGARVHRVRAGVRDLRGGSRPGDQPPLAGVQPALRRGRVHRHDLACALRRGRAELPRTLRGHRGAAGGGRAGMGTLGRRPAERPDAHALRPGGGARRDPAAHRGRRVLLLHRDERAGLGLRPLLRQVPGRAGEGRVEGQRPQDLDEQRPPLALHDRAAAHLSAGRRQPPPRPHPVPGRDGFAGHRGPPDPQPHRRFGFQRGWCSTTSSCPRRT